MKKIRKMTDLVREERKLKEAPTSRNEPTEKLPADYMVRKQSQTPSPLPVRQPKQPTPAPGGTMQLPPAPFPYRVGGNRAAPASYASNPSTLPPGYSTDISQDDLDQATAENPGGTYINPATMSNDEFSAWSAGARAKQAQQPKSAASNVNAMWPMDIGDAPPTDTVTTSIQQIPYGGSAEDRLIQNFNMLSPAAQAAWQASSGNSPLDPNDRLAQKVYPPNGGGLGATPSLPGVPNFTNPNVAGTQIQKPPPTPLSAEFSPQNATSYPTVPDYRIQPPQQQPQQQQQVLPQMPPPLGTVPDYRIQPPQQQPQQQQQVLPQMPPPLGTVPDYRIPQGQQSQQEEEMDIELPKLGEIYSGKFKFPFRRKSKKQ
jgi:hypothetical protein